MKRIASLASLLLQAVLLSGCTQTGPAPASRSNSYDDLLAFFRDFREFQKPVVTNGVPDYTAAAMSRQKDRITEFRERLAAIDPSGWPVEQRVDYEVVRAELNGLDFDHRVLRPWSRMPGFYAVLQTSEPDVPLREGPEIHGVLNLWQYAFPLDPDAQEQVRLKLAAIPAVLAQAKQNLVEDTRDLWILGIRQKRDESEDLAALADRFRGMHPELVPLVEEARRATDEFRGWMEARLPSLRGPSGIGVAEYDWYQKHVHLVPYSWAEQMKISQRELERALSYLKLEEHRNRDLPRLREPSTLEELQQRRKQAVGEYFAFLRQREIFTVADYMWLDDGAGSLVPPERRDFFTRVDYLDPFPLLCHSIHWLEKAREKRNSHPIRGVPLLYNIWDSRAEGMATAFEELMMGAGLYDPNPRGRELVYIMLAFRAVRAIMDLKLHSGEMDVESAVDYAVNTTPYGWVLRDGSTIWGDAAIYLSQPGYGTSYVVGKVQVEKLIAAWASRKGADFELKAFLDDFFARGLIPQSLIHWEMTGRREIE